MYWLRYGGEVEREGYRGNVDMIRRHLTLCIMTDMNMNKIILLGRVLHPLRQWCPHRENGHGALT